MSRRLPVPLPEDAPPGIYAHIPFCSHICPYCDFNTYAGQESLIPAYVDALISEMRIAAEREAAPAAAPTLFLGGGTPSLLEARQVAAIVDAAAELFSLAADAEVSAEVNPESIDREYLADIRSAGVNRLSIGVQSQQRAGLRVLGRGHRSADAEGALRAARQAGFDNVSLDFIFGWPGQTLEGWDADLSMILDWEPEHVSLYSLIVESGTPMAAAVERGILTVVDDDTVADYYELAEERLSGAGWEHYEIANWARQPGLRSRHNQLYWQNGQYHGFGAGAHGYRGRMRSSNLRLPSAYIEAVGAGRRPLAMAETIDDATSMGETMMLGLRLLVDGVDRHDFRARHGAALETVYADQIERFTAAGVIEWRGDRLALTPRGSLLANDICAEFLP